MAGVRQRETRVVLAAISATVQVPTLEDISAGVRLPDERRERIA